MSETPRWGHRFVNFRLAYTLLQEGVKQINEGENGQLAIGQLTEEGVIHRFRFCMELSWKVLKDYLQEQGIVFNQITPRTVIKEAVASKLISAEDGATWMKALDIRNKISYFHIKATHDAALIHISTEYLPCVSALYQELASAYTQGAWKQDE